MKAATHLDTAAIRSRRKLRRSDLFIANRPPNSKPPSPLESRRDDLKIAQGKAPALHSAFDEGGSLRAPPWVYVPKILFPLSPSEGEEGRGEGFLQRFINWRPAGGLPFFYSLETEAVSRCALKAATREEDFDVALI